MASAADLAGVWTCTDNTGVTCHTLVLPGSYDFRSLDSHMAEGVGFMTRSGTTLGGSITVYPPAAYSAVHLADLAGTYAADPAHASTGFASTLTVDPDGTFTLVNASSSGQGTLTPVAMERNAFTTTLAVTPTAGSPESFTGLSFLRPGTTPAIVLMTSRATGENSGIFTRPAPALRRKRPDRPRPAGPG